MDGEMERLWLLAFGENERAWAELFFAHRFVPEQSLVYLENGVLASMLFMLPLTLVSGEKHVFRALYLRRLHRPGSAFARVQHRTARRGRKMTQGAHADILVPSSEGLFDYYAARGFYTQFSPHRAGDVC